MTTVFEIGPFKRPPPTLVPLGTLKPGDGFIRHTEGNGSYRGIVLGPHDYYKNGLSTLSNAAFAGKPIVGWDCDDLLVEKVDIKIVFEK